MSRTSSSGHFHSLFHEPELVRLGRFHSLSREPELVRLGQFHSLFREPEPVRPGHFHSTGATTSTSGTFRYSLPGTGHHLSFILKVRPHQWQKYYRVNLIKLSTGYIWLLHLLALLWERAYNFICAPTFVFLDGFQMGFMLNLRIASLIFLWQIFWLKKLVFLHSGEFLSGEVGCEELLFFRTVCDEELRGYGKGSCFSGDYTGRTFFPITTMFFTVTHSGAMPI
jgi:hypothetical protein